MRKLREKRKLKRDTCSAIRAAQIRQQREKDEKLAHLLMGHEGRRRTN